MSSEYTKYAKMLVVPEYERKINESLQHYLSQFAYGFRASRRIQRMSLDPYFPGILRDWNSAASESKSPLRTLYIASQIGASTR